MQTAYADDEMYTTTTIHFDYDLPKTDIELAEDAYNEAIAGTVQACLRTSACQMRIDVLEKKIPVQQERSDEAMRDLYKLQDRKYDIVEMLLSSNSLDDFIKQAEYIESVSRSNLNTINNLIQMKQQLEVVRASLEETSSQSKAAVEEARATLDSLRAARVAKHVQAVGGSGGSSALDDGADWNMSLEEFVAAWAPRLDAYLAGSPLAGQGANFARSAWRYCIDPRWSAAISNTESSKGAHCIRPHNAWGWGAADSDPYGLASQWGSWEEAIDAHAAGLAKGYGYTISQAGAQSYCPLTWESWYNNTLSEMARI